MIIATPSNHWPIVDALGAQGFTVVHCDEHVRAHLLALDPPISGEAVLVNRGSGGRLSQKLAEMRQQLVARSHRSGRTTVDVHPEGHRVTITRHDRDGDTTDHDLFDELAARHPELRRMIDATRGLLPHPTFEDNTVIVGCDSETQATLPPDGVALIYLNGCMPSWAVEPRGPVHQIDGDLSPAEQGAAAVEAVRQPVAA